MLLSSASLTIAPKLKTNLGQRAVIFKETKSKLELEVSVYPCDVIIRSDLFNVDLMILFLGFLQ